MPKGSRLDWGGMLCNTDSSAARHGSPLQATYMYMHTSYMLHVRDVARKPYSTQVGLSLTPHVIVTTLIHDVPLQGFASRPSCIAYE